MQQYEYGGYRPLRISYPACDAVYTAVEVVTGFAPACTTVTVSVPGRGSFFTVAEADGYWEAELPFTLSDGSYRILAGACVCDCAYADCVYFSVLTHAPLPDPIPPPTIDSPANGAVIADRHPFLIGRGEPGYTVRVCLDDYGCQTVPVDAFGQYRTAFPQTPEDGAHTVTAVQIHPDGRESTPVTSTFTVETGTLILEPVSDETGPTFRTVSVRFTASALPAATATVYYLMVPPASPAPTVAQMLHYSPTADLTDGTAVRGNFTLDLSAETRALSRLIQGNENVTPVNGETGAVDGHLYDVYFYAETPAGANSGVLAFPLPAMAMPFDGGDGMVNQPYVLRALTQAELTRYPDLVAGHPINEAGVDRTARMLENIERLQALYDHTDGFYGRADSLSLAYTLTTPLDLSGYAEAYGGDGWMPLGDYDASYYTVGMSGRHVFRGSLTGGGNTVTGLPLTPRCKDGSDWVQNVGLFGRTQNATIQSLTLSQAISAPQPCAGLTELNSGLIAGYAESTVFRGVTLTDCAMTFIPFDSSASVRGGGIIGQFTGGTLTDCKATSVRITGDPMPPALAF